MSGLSQKMTIGEFQQLMGSDAQKFPAFLRTIANVAKPADVRMLKVSQEDADITDDLQTSWAGWKT